MWLNHQNFWEKQNDKSALGKRALITAAGQGIGKTMAWPWQRGAHVFATDINQETLNDLSDGAKV